MSVLAICLDNLLKKNHRQLDVWSSSYSCFPQRKYQSSSLLALCEGNPKVNSPHKRTTDAESTPMAWRHPAEVTHCVNLLAPVWPITMNSILQTKRSNQNQLFVDIINAPHWISTWERSILKLDAYNETIAHNCHQGDNFDLSHLIRRRGTLPL